jgi:hypothetical protein
MRLFIILLALYITPGFALTEFKLDFKLPKDAKLKLMHNQEDAAGYTRIYHVLINGKMEANKMSALTITHGRNVKFTPKEAMAEVLQVHKYADCKQKQANVIKLYDNVIVFATLLNECTNGKSLVQIYKSFSTGSGQYGINYSGNPQTIPKQTMLKMEHMIESARIVPIGE